ncbi:MAG: PIN domain-containing protein [Chthonomonadales bacterium]
MEQNSIGGLLLDADVVIDILRNYVGAKEWFYGMKQFPMVSGVATLEVAFGARDKSDLRRTLDFINRLEIVWPTEEDFLFALNLVSKYGLSHGTGPIDAVSAAVAIRLNMTLVSHNRKHFDPIPGLILMTPYSR